jgi:hypothetical protein
MDRLPTTSAQFRQLRLPQRPVDRSPVAYSHPAPRGPTLQRLRIEARRFRSAKRPKGACYGYCGCAVAAGEAREILDGAWRELR